MTTNEEIYVTEEILTYYDSKIKNYIEDKIKEPKDELSEVERRVDAVETDSAVNAANIASNREDIDELEIAARAMQETLANVRVALENKVEASDLDKYLTKELAESTYYTKEQVADRIQEAIDLIPDVDTNNLVTKDELERALDDVATKDDLTVLNNAVADVEASLEDKADKDYVTSEIQKAKLSIVDNYYTKHEVNNLIPDVSNLATREELEEAINNIEHPTVDLSDYYTKAEVDEAIANIEHPTVNLDGYATEDWVNEQGFLKEHQDLSEYAKKSEVPSIEGLATEDFVKSEIAKAELNGGEVTEEELEKLLANYYNKSEINALIPEVPTKVSQLENDANYLTEHQSLEGYAKLTDIPDVSTFATKTEVADQLDNIKIPTKVSELDNDSKFVTEDNLSDYAKRDELFSKDYNDLINTPVIPSVEGLATEQFVKDEIAKIEYPTVDLTGYAKEDWIHEQGFITEIPSEYITESELNAKGYLTEHQDLSEYAKKSDIPDVTGFATKDEVTTVENKIPSIEGLATEQFVENAIANIPTTDLSDYYTKGETDSAINEAIDGIKIPEVDLTLYATKEQVTEQVAAKANNVPFTTDMFVIAAQGGFANGDNLKGMSIESILTKLLGLQSVITPDEPDIPDEPTTIVDKIIAEQIPMYSVSANGELISTDFHLIDGNTEPTESGFYVINDELGNILEAGYQDLQVENDEIYYVIALPKEVNYNTVVKVQTYDPDDKMWVDSRIDLTADPDIVDSCCEEAGIDITHIDTNKYTVWVQESICTGSIIRYRIVEEN